MQHGPSPAPTTSRRASRGEPSTNEGTLTRSGTGVSDVGVATANSGAVSVKQGKLEFSSTVTNTGTMTATGSVLELTQAVSGVGALDIGTGGVMDIVRGKDAGQTVDFLGTGNSSSIPRGRLRATSATSRAAT